MLQWIFQNLIITCFLILINKISYLSQNSNRNIWFLLVLYLLLNYKLLTLDINERADKQRRAKGADEAILKISVIFYLSRKLSKCLIE